ncbi:MAG: transcription antitermination factor NusB [Acidimicrobiales bacterium]
MSAGRREARERALGLLYEAEARSESVSTILEGLPVAADPYAVSLVTGVDADRATIDELIVRFARDWKLERMPAIDRALLRMAIHELLSEHEVPTGVVISEAVELASEYSTDESGRFVNGMLSRIAAEVRPTA